jgi:hypothetical protein
LAPSRCVDAPISGAKYGRLFPELPRLEWEDELLALLGSHGGLCDAGPDAERDDDAREAAGWPFFGQFVAHDITADRSPLAHQADTDLIRNLRTPRLNLECVYGEGPTGAPYLFDRTDPAKFLLGRNDAGRPDDLPRNSQGTALIPDPRNDVHVVVSQLHVAFLKLHNRLVDRLRAEGVPEGAVHEAARRETTWRYQWIVLHDFLPRLIGPELTAELLAGGRRYFRPAVAPYIPFEFADAAYRYGHSQVRHTYRLNVAAAPAPVLPDLMGFGPVPAARAIDWKFLFDLPGRPPAQRAKKIDGRLATSLIRLPVEITGVVEVEAYHSLAVRDLQRGQGVGLPSGEAVAGLLGVEPLTPAETGLGAAGWDGETPLWYYVLKEAEVREDGDRLFQPCRGLPDPLVGRLVVRMAAV